ncbi:MAG: amylo-alpha-1,6-glucosidase [Bacteroidota bacterium]
MKKNNQTISFANSQVEDHSNLEWIVSNGLGGYASSTFCGMNTRRYHGILVASMNPPVERKVFVAKVEEEIVGEGDPIAISTNQYPGTVYPEGYAYIQSVSRFPLPTTQFEVGPYSLKKTLTMVQGSSTTCIAYQNTSQRPFTLKIRPHLTDRNFHDLFYESGEFNFHTENFPYYMKVYPRYGSEGICMGFEGGTYQEDRAWFKNVEYLKEQSRGLDFQEDTFSPGWISFKLAPGEIRYLVFSLDEAMMLRGASDLFQAEIKRVDSKGDTHQESWRRDLEQVASQFLVKRASTQGFSLLAGYHWFGDWGRDTMMALRGLTLATGKLEAAQSILRTFLQNLNKGLIPSRFPDQGTSPIYQSVDASLWLFIAMYEYIQNGGSWEFVEEVLPQLQEILDSYIQGTYHNIHINKEGLVFAGTPNSQLTWMDSFIWGYSVTPRWGCAVEINALWYNALRIFQYFSDHLERNASAYLPFISLQEENFRRYFWHPMGYLYDVVIPGEQREERIRPNQLFALSLPFKVLSKKDGSKILQVVKNHLYTQKGLRTLSPFDSEFKPVYEGNLWDRDTAYHQGTVWSFLLTEYLEAYLWVVGNTPDTKRWAESALMPLRKHFYQQNCIGGISEIFDGKNPDLGKGCINHALGIGNVLWFIHQHKLFAPLEDKESRPVAISVGN